MRWKGKEALGDVPRQLMSFSFTGLLVSEEGDDVSEQHSFGCASDVAS